LEGEIAVGSIFKTDGYPSYPNVSENLGLIHRVVNHTQGFKADDGTHTNNIEGFWASLKGKMRKEHGVRRIKIDDWIVEFSFWKKFVAEKTSSECTPCILELFNSLIIYQ
jgi:hypothetical protein